MSYDFHDSYLRAYGRRFISTFVSHVTCVKRISFNEHRTPSFPSSERFNVINSPRFDENARNPLLYVWQSVLLSPYLNASSDRHNHVSFSRIHLNPSFCFWVLWLSHLRQLFPLFLQAISILRLNERWNSFRETCCCLVSLDRLPSSLPRRDDRFQKRDQENDNATAPLY